MTVSAAVEWRQAPPWGLVDELVSCREMSAGALKMAAEIAAAARLTVVDQCDVGRGISMLLRSSPSRERPRPDPNCSDRDAREGILALANDGTVALSALTDGADAESMAQYPASASAPLDGTRILDHDRFHGPVAERILGDII